MKEENRTEWVQTRVTPKMKKELERASKEKYGVKNVSQFMYVEIDVVLNPFRARWNRKKGKK